MIGMPPTSPTIWPVVVVVTLVVGSPSSSPGAGSRLLARTVACLARSSPAAPAVGRARYGPGRRCSSGACGPGSSSTGSSPARTRSSPRRTPPGATAAPSPRSRERSGSPQSPRAWEDLGYYGAVLRARRARPWRSSRPSTAPAPSMPIRVYAGLQSANTVQGRADLVLAELKRTGAFDRKVLVVATTTGMGFLDSRGTDPLEYLWNGDTAIAGVQYSYLPSWISVLADQEAVVDHLAHRLRDGAAVLGDAARGERPALYLYGLSLGLDGRRERAHARSTSSTSRSTARFMVGPPFVNEMHGRLERERDAGSPASLPVYEDGPHGALRRTSEGGLDPVVGGVGPDPGRLPPARLRPGRVLLQRPGVRPAASGSPTGSAGRTSRPPWAGCPS